MNYKNLVRTKYHYVVLGFALILVIAFSSFIQPPTKSLQIPDGQDWVYKGIALNKGSSSSWDAIFFGAISPSTMIKKSGTYFLYYIGARNPMVETWGQNRAVGVATSKDGIHFTKYTGNPIITYSPNNDGEEGIFSAVVTLDENGNIVMFVGAMKTAAKGSPEVVSDIRLYTSSDGYRFADQGVVVSHSDSKVWGYGDELFPVGVFRIGSNYYVYYIAEGGVADWDLGLAWGSSKSSLPNTKSVLILSYADRPSSAVPIQINAEQHAIFIQYRTQEKMDVRTIYDSNPASFSSVVKTYQVEGGYLPSRGGILTSSTVFFDRDTNTWFMYYLSSDGSMFKVKTSTGKQGGG